MWFYLCAAWLGATIVVGIMCLFQINEHEEIENDSKYEK